MSAILVTIDEVPVTATDHGLVVCEDNDPNQQGSISFTVEVEHDADGEWSIVQVYRDKKGQRPIVGKYGIEIARWLEGYAEKSIQDKIAGLDLKPAARGPWRSETYCGGI